MRLTVPAPAHGRATNAHPASVVLSLHQPSSETDPHGVNLQQTISHTTASVSNVVHASVIHSASVEGIQDTASNNNACRLSVIGSDGGRRSRDVGVVSVNGEVVSGCSTSVAVPALRTWGSQTEEPGSGAPAPATRVVGPPQLPPPYSTLPHAYSIHAQPQPLPPPPLQQHAYPFQPVSLRRCQYGEDSERPKTCCGAGGARALSLRWFIVLVALTGVCCVLVGTVLGAVRAQGRAHLTVLLLMIGVGLVLVIVSGVAWRAAGRRRGRAARAAATGVATGVGPTRRVPSACARAHHPYAAMLYPEFHCRAPPPSYQVSMQDYRLRLLHFDRGASPPPITCPPPAYRPRPRGVASGNPQYMGGRGARGRRRPEPRTPAPQLSSVVIQNIALEPYDEIKYDDEPELGPPIGCESKEEEVHLENKEGNLVTIVQTGEDTSPVIVTVSGSMPEERTQSQTHTSEIDILAHL